MQKDKNYLIQHYLLGLLVICLALSFSTIMLAQQNEINFNEITTKDGLLDDVVITIVQDAKGYMWFGTRSGLVRYDGINFQNFTFDPDLPDGLSGNNIIGLHIDKDGVLWIGTINGLCRFDEKLDRPVKIPIKINDKHIYPYIQAISSSKDSLIWLATLDDGLFSYDPILNKSVQFIHSPNDKNSILSDRIFSLICTSDDLLWIGTDKGWNTYDQTQQIFKPIIIDKDNPKTTSDNIIISIKEGNNGDLWCGTNNSGLKRFNPQTGLISNYKFDKFNNNSISSNYVRSILFNNNKVWFGSGRGDDALNSLDTETGIIEKYNIVSQNQIFGGSTNEIFIDNTGIIWVAQSLNGIKYFDPKLKYYDQYYIDNSGNENSVNRIYGINPVSNTKLWASTFNGLVLFDLNNGPQKQFRDQASIMLLQSNSIFVQNELWIPSRNRGIVKFNIKTEKFNYIQNNSKNKQSLSSNYVNVILQDQEGIVWSGSRDGGLDRIDPKTKNIKRYNNMPSDLKSLPNNSVYALFEKNENELWVGTNGGLALFDKKNESFENYVYDANDSLSLSSDQISYILESKKGEFWIGTYGGGLNRFNYDTKIFQRYTSHKNNIPNNTVYSLVEDDKGFLWVSTAKGIAQFSPITETYDYLIELPDNYKVNKFPNGNIVFSGPRGILTFDPNNIKINSFPPIVSLTKFNINSGAHSKVSNDSLKYILTKTGTIELNYSQNDINLEFTVAHYSNSKKNELSVFLEGNDNNWRSLGSARSINYTNLDPGEYTLNAKGASAFGVWTEEPITFTIIINPPWWKTWWAYLSYILLGLGFLYTVRNIELKRQRKNADIKESKLRAETAEFQAKAAEAQSRVIQAENDRKSAELEEARQLQLSMLPKELPKVENLDIAVYMKTATEVGGDYYDFSIKENGSINICLGDATGHGMKAGTLVSMIKSLFTVNSIDKSLEEFFSSTNEALKNAKLDKMMMAFAMLNINGNKISMTNAGIPPFYIYRKEKELVEEVIINGLPLGAMNNTKYEIYESELLTGDTILMLSDGFPELQNKNNEMYGYDRVISSFQKVANKSSEEISNYLKDEASKWINGKDPDDDVTFVVIKVKFVVNIQSSTVN